VGKPTSYYLVAWTVSLFLDTVFLFLGGLGGETITLFFGSGGGIDRAHSKTIVDQNLRFRSFRANSWASKPPAHPTPRSAADRIRALPRAIDHGLWGGFTDLPW